MTPEERAARKEYMRSYYESHPEKWPGRTREQRDAYNAARRAKYAADAATREKAKADAKAWQEANPHMRKAQRIKKYGLTLDAFNAMLERAGHKCEICGYSDKSDPNRFPLVDHCHASGRVRGIICQWCNHGIGKFKDDPERLRAAATYLEGKKG